MLATGCDDKDDGDDQNGAILAKEPATVTECGEGPHPSYSSGSTGIGMPEVTMHWLAGTHSFGDSATLYLCQERPIVGTVKVAPSPGIQVSPTSFSFNPTDEVILKIVVTVDSNAKSGASVDLGTTVPNDFTAPLGGPRIRVANDRWSFDLSGRASHEQTHPDNTSRNVILLGVLGCIVGVVCFVAGIVRNSGRGVAAAVVVFLLGVALVLVGFGTRPPPAPLYGSNYEHGSVGSDRRV
jgi:hypothetical protein